ncbi:MAG: hypothetical protein QNJ98_17900 [Planctomycetota bacterium]|nr:hypothetical protein [Planctomycetota bacterium]
MVRLASRLSLVLLVASALLVAGCAHGTQPLPGTPCCGVECQTTCWPKGRIGPFCPQLCEDCEEPECPRCPPGTYPGYTGPKPGKMSS